LPRAAPGAGVGHDLALAVRALQMAGQSSRVYSRRLSSHLQRSYSWADL